MTEDEFIPPSHPLQLLDDFLSTLPTAYNDGDHSVRKNNNRQIFEIGDFLYGVMTPLHHRSPGCPRPLTSILDGALELLEASLEDTKQGFKNRGADTNPNVPVRTIIGRESGRRVMIVRGSSNGDVPEYICTFGFDTNIHDNERQRNYRLHEKGTLAIGKVGYHCSCRSFLERLKGDKFALCKHLLAARLAPFLSSGDHVDGKWCPVYLEEVLDEEDFGRIYSRVSLSMWQ
jgi:hypothetical protein